MRSGCNKLCKSGIAHSMAMISIIFHSTEKEAFLFLSIQSIRVPRPGSCSTCGNVGNPSQRKGLSKGCGKHVQVFSTTRHFHKPLLCVPRVLRSLTPPVRARHVRVYRRDISAVFSQNRRCLAFVALLWRIMSCLKTNTCPVKNECKSNTG